MKTGVPDSRIRSLNAREFNPGGEYVVYWMTTQRRTTHNFALERAVDWAVDLRRGLLVLEALRCDYRWASERFHRFVIDGMEDNLKALQGRNGVTFHPYVERTPGEGRGLIEALGEKAAVIVTDDYPTYFLPHMLETAARRVRVKLEAVDANGLLPMFAAPRPYPSAYTFRRYMQKVLPGHLAARPAADPIRRLEDLKGPDVPPSVTTRWPSAEADLRSGGPDLDPLPLDHSIGTTGVRGGQQSARDCLEKFLRHRLDRYAEDRNQPEEDVASGLSPYLHFGHISTHAILEEGARREDWAPVFEGEPSSGRRVGWWGMSEQAEAFLDQLVTWRELGFNMAARRPDHREYESLPGWALETLEKHAVDARPYLYDLQQLDAASTHDELWNAAQRQLRRDGRIHNYLRMLWGKKILEWTASPREAARVMIELNNRYAIDGRDPNSYSGIFWCLGRYDRPWGPERPVFGKIRYMSSTNTARKLRIGEYVARYAE